MWKNIRYLAALAGAFWSNEVVEAGHEACTIIAFSNSAFPVEGNFSMSISGVDFPTKSEDVLCTLFSIANKSSTISGEVTEARSEHLAFYVSPQPGFVPKDLYGVKIQNATTSEVLCSMSINPAVAHDPLQISSLQGDFLNHTESSIFNIAGRETITIQGSDFFRPANPSDVIARYRTETGQDIGLDKVSAKIVVDKSIFAVQTVIPPIPRPVDWKTNCPDQENPQKSATCIPDISIRLSISIDGGLSFSNEIMMTFGWVPPLRIAFVYQSKVDDDGWTMRINEGRNQLELQYGSIINASTYYENIPEGEFEGAQANKGYTCRDDTPVPEFVSDGGIQRKNRYYDALTIMKKLCDEDFDLVVAGTFGFSSQAFDVSEYYKGCQYKGSGDDSTSQPHSTYFLSTAGNRVGKRLSNGAGKMYQMRYLTGLIAGNQLLTLKSENRATNEELCVGYIGAYPIPEVQRGINAFLLGCQHVFPECKVKVLWSGVWRSATLDEKAAEFLWNVGGCRAISTHSDTLSPHVYFRNAGGGTSFGYNDEVRAKVGDTVLSSILLQWEPILHHFVDMVYKQSWLSKDVWFGVDKEAVRISPFFSPIVPDDFQELVLREKTRLEGLSDDDAFRTIFCGNLQKRWVYKIVENGNARSQGCGFQPNWVRLGTPESLNFKHFTDAEGNTPSSSAQLGSSTCLNAKALLQDAFPPSSGNNVDEDLVYNDYLLDGVELFEPQETVYGTVYNTTNHGCFSALGTVGDRFFSPAKEYVKCDGKQWRHSRGTCDPATMQSSIVYEWIKNETTNEITYCGSAPDESGKFSTIADLPFVEFGPACDYVAWGSSTSTIVLAVVSVSMLFHLGNILMILHFRNNGEVKSMQPKLVIAMAIGGILLNASTVMFLGEDTSSSCINRIWFFNISFDIVFAFLWARIYRVYMLFSTTKKMKRVVIRDKDMLRMALSLIMVDVVVIVLWALVDPPVPQVDREVLFTLPEPAEGSITFVECQSQSGTFMSASLTYKVLLVLTACYLVFASKNIPSSYVEHKFIIFGTYNTAIFSFIVLLATIMTSDSPELAVVIHAFGVGLGSMIVVGSIAIPRFAVAIGKIRVRSTMITQSNSASSDGRRSTIQNTVTAKEKPPPSESKSSPSTELV